MIQLADTPEKIEKCKEVMLNLRPHISPSEFAGIVNGMMKSGYQMVFVEEDNKAVSVGGFVTGYKFYSGNLLYIDDLNTLPDYRKKGYAFEIMNWIINYAKEKNIDQVHLDSGVHRFDAHRFYLKYGYNITSHHFALNLTS